MRYEVLYRRPPTILARVLTFLVPVLMSFHSWAQCSPLPAPSGTVIEVSPSQAGQLAGIVNGAAANSTILLTPGTYRLTSTIYLRTAGVQLRGKTGNRDDVIIDAEYGNAREMVNLVGSNTVLADLTLMRSLDHPIHVQPFTASASGVLIHNVHIIDPGQQAIKVNQNGSFFTDNGTIRCSKIELTDIGRTAIRDNCYTGGVDIHQSRGWKIHDNVVIGFWCPSGLSEHGIHVWTGSRDTLVERNILIDNARGIGFGLGFQWSGRGYSDSPCAGRVNIGHYGGTIRNNFIAGSNSGLTSSQAGYDVGISLEDTCEVQVLHNSVYGTSIVSSAIEWRFARNDGKTVGPTLITNNLTSHRIRSRDGATATEAGNFTAATTQYFRSAIAGDLHLTSNATQAIDKGVNAGVTTDIDVLNRDSKPDVGASEFGAVVVPTATPTATPSPTATLEPGVTPSPTPTNRPGNPQNPTPTPTSTPDPESTVIPEGPSIAVSADALEMSWLPTRSRSAGYVSKMLTIWVKPNGFAGQDTSVSVSLLSAPKGVSVRLKGNTPRLKAGRRAKIQVQATSKTKITGKIKISLKVRAGNQKAKQKVVIGLKG